MEIEYFQPHTFRHLAVNLVTKKCKDGFKIKAVSQNLGHENISTTMMTYGSLNNSQLAETIRGIDFEKSENMDLDQFEQFKQFQKFQRMQKSRF
ncbi:MAG: tyrosine-type recombinase/integrase [Candidatus Caenarcaniphilales bacterium]|nr:tyrosine-type recombinase/integrase [Candidatus Caenarcaniphilales bacterium]